MKKLLAILLAAACTLSIGVTAFAKVPVFSSGEEALKSLVEGMTNIRGDSDGDSNGGSYYAIVESKDDATNPEKGNDTVKPGKKVYYWVNSIFADKDLFKVSFKKGQNAKAIKSIKLLEKIMDSDAWYLFNDQSYYEEGYHEAFVVIELNDSMIDNDTKIDFEMTVTTKDDIRLDYDSEKAFLAAENEGKSSSGDEGVVVIPKGTKYTLKSQPIWVNNKVQNGDQDYDAGKGGYVLKPTKNDDNEIVWNNENRDLAKLKFAGDSDVNKFYPKLSTKWDDSAYQEQFADQDAFIFSFVGTPGISATSRPTLEIVNPFYNADDDAYSTPMEEVIIYEVIDGELVDVTAQWSHGTNDDGDEVFTLKARTLGTYIFAQSEAAKAAQAEAEAAAEAEPKTPAAPLVLPSRAK